MVISSAQKLRASTHRELARSQALREVKVEGSKGQGDNFYKLCERLGMGEWRMLKQQEGLLKSFKRPSCCFSMRHSPIPNRSQSL